MRKAFVCTNAKQVLGAKLAAFALTQQSKGALPVEVITVEEVPAFKAFVGSSFRRGKEERTYTFDDLQSFTLTRFMPPELMSHTGEALVIDPDVFAIADPTGVFDYLAGSAAIAACPKERGYDTSVMVLDCARLGHWKIADMLSALRDGARDYNDYMSLLAESAPIAPLPRAWNSLDSLSPETNMLHTTRRLTQPWKTGLPIDFTLNRAPKILGLIPREPVSRLLGRLPTRYSPHPDATVERFFFSLLAEALAAGAVTESFLKAEMAAGHARPDLLDMLR